MMNGQAPRRSHGSNLRTAFKSSLRPLRSAQMLTIFRREKVFRLRNPNEFRLFRPPDRDTSSFRAAKKGRTRLQMRAIAEFESPDLATDLASSLHLEVTCHS